MDLEQLASWRKLLGLRWVTQMSHDPYCQVSLKSPNAITYLAFEFQKHFREREEILSTTAGPALIEGSFENDADL